MKPSTLSRKEAEEIGEKFNLHPDVVEAIALAIERAWQDGVASEKVLRKLEIINELQRY